MSCRGGRRMRCLPDHRRKTMVVVATRSQLESPPVAHIKHTGIMQVSQDMLEEDVTLNVCTVYMVWRARNEEC